MLRNGSKYAVTELFRHTHKKQKLQTAISAVKHAVRRGEYIKPFKTNIHKVEHETAEQAVLCIRDEALNLSGRTRQKSR